MNSNFIDRRKIGVPKFPSIFKLDNFIDGNESRIAVGRTATLDDKAP